MTADMHVRTAWRTMSICTSGRRPLARDAHLVARLHRAVDLAFDGRPVETLLELAGRGGPTLQLAREYQPAGHRRQRRLNPVANTDLERAIFVSQLIQPDRSFALGADVDERDVLADGDNRALDGLAGLEAPRLDGRLEHRRKIFLVLAQYVRPVVRSEDTGIKALSSSRWLRGIESPES
jgi:hypothetical protein